MEDCYISDEKEVRELWVDEREKEIVEEKTQMDNKEKNYLEQIDRYYKKQLKSNEMILLGDSPQYFSKINYSRLPVYIKQSTLGKCIREPNGSKSAHCLSREIIENMQEQLYSPALIVLEKERNSIALITCYKDTIPLLLAVKGESNLFGNLINEVTSFYERKNLEFYLTEKHTVDEILILDKEKAKSLSRFLRLQLPTAWKVLDCSDICNERLQLSDEKVNEKICKDLKENGFQPNKRLVEKMARLNQFTGNTCSIRDVHTIYSGLKNPDIQKLIMEIAGECKQQEIEIKNKREKER